MKSFKTTYNLVKDAYTLLHNKKYTDAILILEKVTATGIEDPYPFLLLAIAYLFADKFTRIGPVLSRMRALNKDYLPLVQLDAFLKLKSAVNRETIFNIYVDLVNAYPADPYLHRMRRLLSYTENFIEFQKNARVQDFVHVTKPPRSLKKYAENHKMKYKIDAFDQPAYKPPRAPFSGREERIEKRLKPWDIRHAPARPVRALRRFKINAALISRIILYAAVPLAIGAIAVHLHSIGWFGSMVKDISGMFPKRGIDPARVDMVSITGEEYELIKKINKEKVPVFYYSSNDLFDDFNKAKQLLKAGEYNKGLFILNRIFNSNVSFIVKEKADFLIKFVISAEDRKFEPVPYDVIAKDTYLYRGFAVKWRGQVTNLHMKNDKPEFTLMVDFKDKKSVAGLAEIYSEAPDRRIKDGDMVEIDAVFLNTIGESGKLYLAAREIRVL